MLLFTVPADAVATTSDDAATDGSFSLRGTRSSHRWQEPPIDRLNLRAIYPSDNEWGIPTLKRTEWTPARLVSYSDRRGIAKVADSDAAVHFFLDDYRFETVWTKPERALSRAQSVGGALTPDFSLWRDMPLSMQLWQVYRSRWCGAWLAEHHVRVIPTISWSTAESFPFAFLGVEAGSIVAVSTVGIRRGDMALFESGYAEMVRRLSPSLVLIYGRAPTRQVSGLCESKTYETRWKRWVDAADRPQQLPAT